MEMKPRNLAAKCISRSLAMTTRIREEAKAARAFLGNQVWLFEAYGTTKASRIMEVFRYARKRYGVTHFVVDSLAKCGFGEDDYNGQKVC